MSSKWNAYKRNLSRSDFKTSNLLLPKELWQDTVPFSWIKYMITQKIMNILHDAIQIFDKRCGMRYLIIFGTKSHYQFVQIQIKQSHFWHLLGCKLIADTNEEKRNTYLNCKNKIDVSGKIFSIHGYSEIQEKFQAIQNVFDFISNAHQTKIGYAVDCPEQYIFQIGTGNERGIIGYDYPSVSSKSFLIPKSAQLKSLSKVSKTAFRIFVILSKEQHQKAYENIEYEIKKGITSEYLSELPEEININLKTQ